MSTKIHFCRICRSTSLQPLVDFKRMALTSVFPKSRGESVPMWPLELVRCAGDPAHSCGLVQLAHRYPQNIIFGRGYGYRSGLNPVIECHLKSIAGEMGRSGVLKRGDVVMDIGSNDGTLLNAFKGTDVQRIGIDPTADKFSSFYDEGIHRVSRFFSYDIARQAAGKKKIKLLTTISIFYDLEKPQEFMRDAARLLDKNGLWVTEQSYLPSMLKNTAFDNICHEHVTYFSFRQMDWMAKAAGLKIIDARLTRLNGGSFKVTLAHSGSRYSANRRAISQLVRQELSLCLHEEKIYKEFSNRIIKTIQQVRSFFFTVKKGGHEAVGYGASTKGNVLLQACGLTASNLSCIADINPDKWGCYTPGSRIPIIDERKLLQKNIKYLFVLPWHFKSYFLKKEIRFLQKGGEMVFPLPQFKIIRK